MGAAAGRMLAVVVFAAAAFLPDRTVKNRTRAAGIWFAAAALALVAVRITFAVYEDRLPQTARHLSAGAHDRVLVVQIVFMALFIVAAFGFARLASRTGSVLMLCFSIAAVLGAFSRLNYVMFPSDFADWFVAADVLRLGLVMVLLFGGVLERRDAQHEVEAAAVRDERRRIARELHDGVAQELAFIVQQTTHLAGKPGASPVMEELVRSAQRALEDSRDAIAALVRPNDEPLGATLARAAEQVARREQVQVDLDVPPDVLVPPETREALLRILREAVTNAARHGGARVVRVECRTEPKLSLQIADDGTGFDPGAVPDNGHYGISGMRERVERLGGAFRMESSPGQGARLEVVLP